MKYQKINFISLLIIFFLISCTDNPINQDLPDNLVGIWIYQSYENNTYIMHKSLNLENDNSGLVILENGKIIERKNAGWCGTPSVVYENYEGSWDLLSENKLKITVGYWGGVEDYTIEIVSLNSSKLIYKKVMI